MLCPFLLHSKATQSYIYTHSLFSYYLPSWSVPRDQLKFPVLYSRTSWLIRSKSNRLHLPTPNPSPSHSLHCPLGNHESGLFVCGSVSILHICSFVSTQMPCFRFHIYVILGNIVKFVLEIIRSKEM